MPKTRPAPQGPRDPVMADMRPEQGGVWPGARVQILAGPRQGRTGVVEHKAGLYHPVLLWKVSVDGEAAPYYPHEIRVLWRDRARRRRGRQP